jgi:hypothetical protein
MHNTDNWAGLADFGLLLGIERDDGGGGSSDNLGLVIGAAISIPLALALIAVIIALVSVWIALKRRAAQANSRGAVSLDDAA